MKRIYFFLLTICLIGMSCEKGQPIVEEFPRTITPTVIAQGELYGDSSGNIPEQNLVIKTQTEWTDLMTAIHLENSSLTNIDFSQHYVIAVFGKVCGNSSWNINITKIVEDSNSIVVTYEEIETENLVDVAAQPFQIVRIPSLDKNIVFDLERRVPYRPYHFSGIWEVKALRLSGELTNVDSRIEWENDDYSNILIEIPDTIQGTIRGHTFCNTIFIGFEIEECQQINIKSYGGTRFSEEEWGMAFRDHLIFHVVKFDISNNELAFMDSQNNPTIIFIKKD